MNSALAHNPFPLDYSDNEFLNQERPFQSGLSSNDYLLAGYPGATSRINSSTQPGSLPISSAITFNSHPTHHEPSLQSNSSPLLSPPASVSGSASAGNNPLHSVAYSQLPKLYSSNASTSENCPTSSFAWSESSMTDYGRSRVPILHPASLSPPLNFGSGHGISGSYLDPPRGLADPYSTHYHIGSRSSLSHTPANFNDMSKYVMAQPRPVDAYASPFSQSGNGFHQPSTTVSSRSSQSRSDDNKGPPFKETNVLYHIITGPNHQQLAPEIIASIQKGFFKVDQKWTCYRRNYFTVNCAFDLKNQVVDGPSFISRHGKLEEVKRFAVAISAKTAVANNQEGEIRSLVQHTPKRDKLSETTPKLQVIQPSPPCSLTAVGGLTVSNHNHCYSVPQHISPSVLGGFDSYGSVHNIRQPPASHTFERIQFQKATANNGKRRAQQQYFHVVVELLGDVGRPGGAEHWVTIATRESHPMVVRGRSPGHYKDNVRRDSTASHDPDSGPGPGGDGSNGHLSLSSIHGDTSHSTNVNWVPSHRHNGHYGGSAYHCHIGFGCSPTSGSSSTFAGSPTELDTKVLGSSQANPSAVLSLKESSQPYSYQQGPQAIGEASNLGSSPKKQACGNDIIDITNTHASRQLRETGLHLAPFDYHVGPHLEAVCAS